MEGDIEDSCFRAPTAYAVCPGNSRVRAAFPLPFVDRFPLTTPDSPPQMQPDRRIRRIAIVGGGIAGWTAAATLARKLGGHCSIHVVDTAESAPATGLAEATLPSILDLLRFLGIEQNDFVDKT